MARHSWVSRVLILLPIWGAAAGAVVFGVMQQEEIQIFFVAVFTCMVMSVLVVGGTALLVHNVRLRWAGHVADAVVTAHRADGHDDESPERLMFTPIVDFVTKAGERRQSVALADSEYGDQDNKPWPPVGHVISIVYDPRDPAWAGRRQGWWWWFASIVVILPLALGTALLFGWAAAWFIWNRVIG